MSRRIERFPTLEEIVNESLVDLNLSAILDPLGLTVESFARHFHGRRVNVPAKIFDNCGSFTLDQDLLRFWLDTLHDIVETDLAGFPEQAEAYATTISGNLTDNGRKESRKIYAAPNGNATPAYVTGQEVNEVTGEYANGAAQAEAFAEHKTFRQVIFSRLEPAFLGVVSEW